MCSTATVSFVLPSPPPTPRAPFSFDVLPGQYCPYPPPQADQEPERGGVAAMMQSSSSAPHTRTPSGAALGGPDDGDNRSRNAKAQRRHREKRKAHFKAVSSSFCVPCLRQIQRTMPSLNVLLLSVTDLSSSARGFGCSAHRSTRGSAPSSKRRGVRELANRLLARVKGCCPTRCRECIPAR